MLVSIPYSFRGCEILLEGTGAPRILNITESIEPLDPLGAPNAEQRSGRLGRGQVNRGLLSLPIWWAGVPLLEALGFGDISSLQGSGEAKSLFQ